MARRRAPSSAAPQLDPAFAVVASSRSAPAISSFSDSNTLSCRATCAGRVELSDAGGERGEFTAAWAATFGSQPASHGVDQLCPGAHQGLPHAAHRLVVSRLPTGD